MADRKGKGILYEEDDELIDIPEQNTSHLIEEYNSSFIGKVLNPKKQEISKLIAKMPQQWGLEDNISADDLGNGHFLFRFETEEDFQSMLNQGPFHFNFWMFMLVRWEPLVHDEYHWEITFWTQFIGLSLHFWIKQMMESIGEKLGNVHQVDDVDARLCITVDSRKPLKFARQIRFHTGEQATIQISYELLFKHCSHCGLMSHENISCPKRALEGLPQRLGVLARLQTGSRPSITSGMDTSVPPRHTNNLIERLNGSRLVEQPDKEDGSRQCSIERGQRSSRDRDPSRPIHEARTSGHQRRDF